MDNFEILEKFIENKELISKGFVLEQIYAKIFSAYIFTINKETPDVQKLKECEDILKNTKGIFSVFRGINMLSILSKMYFCDDKKAYIEDVDNILKELKKYFKWTNENYLLISAIILYEYKNEDFSNYVQKTRNIYDKMKKNHPFLTSATFVPIASMLSMLQKSDDEIIENIEKIYEFLYKEFSNKTALYMLSSTLSMYDKLSIEDRCSKLISFLDALKAADCKYGYNLELPTIAPIVNVEENYSVFAYEIAQLESKLKQTKGFGSFYFTKKQRLMHAVQLMLLNYENKDVDKISHIALNNMTNLTIQNQIMLMTACMTSTMIAIEATN